MGSIDLVLSGVLFIFFFIGIMKGFIKGLIQILGMIFTLYMIANGGQFVKEELISRFSLDPMLATVLSYVVIIVVIALMVKLIIRILDSFVNLINMKGFNRVLGGLFGILNGVVIMAMILVIVDLSPFAKQFYEKTNKSQIVGKVKYLKNEVAFSIPKEKILPIKIDTEKINKNLKKKITSDVSTSKKILEDFIEEKIEKK